MDLIRFDDRCVITRSSLDRRGDAIYDEFDEPKEVEVYNDRCSYQEGGQSSLSIVTRNAQVYLPSNNVMVLDGDMIDVVTARGRKRHGIIVNPRDIEMPLTRELLTKLEIKQGMDKDGKTTRLDSGELGYG